MRRLWAAVRREPVRAYLYGVLAAGEPVVVSYGLLADNQAALWLGVAAAVLVPPAAESLRSMVTPAADPRDAAGRRLVPLR